MADRIKVSVKEGYSRWAPEYDDYPNPLIMLEAPIVHGLLTDDRIGEKRVLDVACGTGRHTLWLAAQKANVTAIDPSREMLAVARSKATASGSKIHWHEGDAAKLPFADASFDVVLNALLMEHVAEVEPILREAHRVLVKGGAFVMSVFHPWFPMKGIPAHFLSGADNREYEMPTFVHLPSEYLRVLIDLEMTLTHFFEPIVDDALIARRANMDKHRGHPLAIILRAVKQS